MKDLQKIQSAKIAYFMQKKNAIFEENGNIKIIRYSVEKSGKTFPACACFVGKGTKPINNYYFHSLEQRENSISEICEGQEVRKGMKEARRKQKTDYIPQSKPGDIFVCSWGYEQTNIDFYQLIEIHGKTGIFIEIGCKFVENRERNGYHDMSAHVVADPSSKIGDIFRKQILPGERINLASYKYCHKWDGREEYCSWYA